MGSKRGRGREEKDGQSSWLAKREGERERKEGGKEGGKEKGKKGKKEGGWEGKKFHFGLKQLNFLENRGLDLYFTKALITVSLQTERFCIIWEHNRNANPPTLPQTY